MQKTKKILFVLIAIVSIVGTLAINCFAYVENNGPNYYAECYIPSATATVTKTGGVTQSPTAFGKPYEPGVYYQGGDAENSVRITVASGVYQEYGFDNTEHNYYAIYYYFVSKNDFDFVIDLGFTPSYINEDLYPGNDWEGKVRPHLRISTTCGNYELINSNGFGYGDYKSYNPYVDYNISCNYLDGDSRESTSCNLASSRNEYYSLYNRWDSGGDAVLDVNGNINNNRYDDTGYNEIIVSILTYRGHTNPDTAPPVYYYDNNLATLGDLSVRTFLHISRLEENNGYDTGYMTGLEEGREIGYKEGQDNFIDERGLFAFVISSIDSLFSFPLFDLPNGGTISLGLILGTIVGALIFVWILKLIAGG